MNESYGLVVRFTLRDADAAAAFDALVARTLEGIEAAEPGTLVYVSHRLHDEPLTRVFYELYADRASFDAHERQPHIQRFLAEREQYVSEVEVTFLDAVAGKVRAQQ
ncbi:antibiotic biosynthesis monooxygenase [Streptomyces sp. NPDC050617]|uniref:putative quinol monooxygenase n=1 Tax=Streptomyces sp. NPDC050617 TaxID=3154628 RepID=UPI0034457E7A